MARLFPAGTPYDVPDAWRTCGIRRVTPPHRRTCQLELRRAGFRAIRGAVVSAEALRNDFSRTRELKARRLAIDTGSEFVVVMHRNCPVCRSEGFTAHNRVLLRYRDRHIIATLYQSTGDL